MLADRGDCAKSMTRRREDDIPSPPLLTNNVFLFGTKERPVSFLHDPSGEGEKRAVFQGGINQDRLS